MPTIKNILKAARLIKKGELVVFPTETVYGLGANALNTKAIKQIFLAKGRPHDNPLIIHIANKQDLYKYAINIPKITEKIIKNFWPGPLTLILNKNKIIPNIATANLKTVALRMPSNKIALKLIMKAGVPIAAPSANSFGKPSPTKAEHVLKDLKGKVKIIIKDKPSAIGLESTVLDLTTKTPTILRPGKITKNDLEKIIKKVKIYKHKKSIKEVKSPGLKYRHYKPNGKVYLFDKNFSSVDLNRKIEKLLKNNKSLAILDFEKNRIHFKNIKFFSMGKTLNSFAKNLFNNFRKCDQHNIDIILVRAVIKKDIGIAIMNRLEKAKVE